MNIDPKLIDVDFHQLERKNPGISKGLVGSFAESELYGAGAVPFPRDFLVPRTKWQEEFERIHRDKATAKDFSARLTHQGNSHECVSHATIQAFEIRRNRQIGLDRAVLFSPVALYTRITGGRQWGGSNVMDALREGIGRGMIPEHDGLEWLGGKGGQAKKFKVTICQTYGRKESHWPEDSFPRESNFPDGWEETARHFRILEAFTISSPEAHFSALIHGFPIVNGRSGHSICHADPVWSDGRPLSGYLDSYNRILYDSERMTGNGYAIASVTIPDSRDVPAGADMKESIAP